MEENKSNFQDINNENTLRNEILRYISFWPIFLVSVIISLAASYSYLRYTDEIYLASSKIQIIDKAQDSEMALPTAMTVFNRSMVNLENELGVLSSYSLHQRVVSKLSSNIKYYKAGNLKIREFHKDNWIKKYSLEFKNDTDLINKFTKYKIEIIENKLFIEKLNSSDEIIESYDFPSLSTFTSKHNLPFELEIDEFDNSYSSYILEFNSFEATVLGNLNGFLAIEASRESDQLTLQIKLKNRFIAIEYLNTLMSEFDQDGIVDRQQKYKRTIDFVNSRSVILEKELKNIEIQKQEFKEVNKISDIQSNANININRQYSYDGELFEKQSQRDLVLLLADELDKENDYKQIPINIGVNDADINRLISEYNLTLKDRDRYLVSAGAKNPLILNINKQLDDIYYNVKLSISNYLESLKKTIDNLENKESEVASIYNSIPENEKILRSIERELTVKESLFLLLLQKKEEASINYAVVKPSIKVIDYARGSTRPISPNQANTYIFSIVLGLIFPFSILYLFFTFDTKIHTKSDLIKATGLPVIGEIPFLKNDNEKTSIVSSFSRTPLAESVRIIISNLNFTYLRNDLDKKAKVILVTSSIKGEGKTIISTNISSLLSSNHKVLLIGCDLRNPQIHKFLGVDKQEKKGISDIIYKKIEDWKKLLIKHDENLDILLSGTIPPNPTQLLSSKVFSNFIEKLKNEYEYIVIDSAPCLLVSDTFVISEHIDNTLYIVRSNFSNVKLSEFIKETNSQNKLKNINLVLNGVGNSQSYGYKYGYQYGYKYGYNYGYGYGYSEEK